MNLRQANKELKQSRNTAKESQVSMVVINRVIAEKPERIQRLLERSGIQGRIEQAIADSERAKVHVSQEGLKVSVDGGALIPCAPKSVDYYLQNVLCLKDKGFYPLYRKLLADIEIVSALALADAVIKHDFLEIK